MINTPINAGLHFSNFGLKQVALLYNGSSSSSSSANPCNFGSKMGAIRLVMDRNVGFGFGIGRNWGFSLIFRFWLK